MHFDLFFVVVVGGLFVSFFLCLVDRLVGSLEASRFVCLVVSVVAGSYSLATSLNG